MGAFLPNRVNVKAVMMRVGTDTSSKAEKLRYLFPDTLVELMMMPLYTNVLQMKQHAISAIRSRIVRERNTDSRCRCSAGCSPSC